jgi:hypothetical protein
MYKSATQIVLSHQKKYATILFDNGLFKETLNDQDLCRQFVKFE